MANTPQPTVTVSHNRGLPRFAPHGVYVNGVLVDSYRTDKVALYHAKALASGRAAILRHAAHGLRISHTTA